MKLLKIILSPFSLLYLLITNVRNFFYDKGIFETNGFPVKIINVGNLSIGGTGKTPHVEYLIHLLKDNYRIATLSRGYKRKSKGFLMSSTMKVVTPALIGDEPMQYFQKFGEAIPIAVGEDRSTAIESMLQSDTALQIILMDDGFQHRKVRPDVNILLTTYQKPFFKDFLLPSGRLRESRNGAARADIIIVSKCPKGISIQEKKYFEDHIRGYSNKNSCIYFSTIVYGFPKPVFPEKGPLIGKDLLIFSGLANSDAFNQHLKDIFNVVYIYNYQDHYSYSSADIQYLIEKFNTIPGNQKSIITTEKDKVKLECEPFRSLLQNISFFYLPIEIDFLENKEEFDLNILNSIKKYNN